MLATPPRVRRTAAREGVMSHLSAACRPTTSPPHEAARAEAGDGDQIFCAEKWSKVIRAINIKAG
jgi:hypothetical protein